MRALILCLLLTVPAAGEVTLTAAQAAVQGAPSAAEVGDLMSKAQEYVDSYREAFIAAKPSLDRASTPGFYDKALELSSQASVFISAIRKNGSTAYALVGLLVVLDDMTINATKAYAATILVAARVPGPAGHDAAADVVNLAKAGQKCYEISELILHPTLKMVSFEEHSLGTVAAQVAK
jgi:hypothetical protein